MEDERVQIALNAYRKQKAIEKVARENVSTARQYLNDILNDLNLNEFADADGYAKFVTTPERISVSDAKGLYAQAQVWAQSDNPDVSTVGQSILLKMKVVPEKHNQLRVK